MQPINTLKKALQGLMDFCCKDQEEEWAKIFLNVNAAKLQLENRRLK